MRSDASRAGWGLKAATWAAVLFLHIPLALIILYAFSAEDKSYVFPPPALTTRWFAAAWEREDVWAAIGLSFRVALVSTALAMVLRALVHSLCEQIRHSSVLTSTPYSFRNHACISSVSRLRG